MRGQDATPVPPTAAERPADATPQAPSDARVAPPAGDTPLPKDIPLTSIAVEQVGPVTPETSVADVLLGSLALVAALIVASLLVGGLVGAVRVYVKHRLGFGGPEADREEHVALEIGKD